MHYPKYTGSNSTNAKKQCNALFIDAVIQSKANQVIVLDNSILNTCGQLTTHASRMLKSVKCIQANPKEASYMRSNLRRRLKKDPAAWNKVSIENGLFGDFILSGEFKKLLSGEGTVAVFFDAMGTWTCESTWGSSVHDDTRSLIEQFATFGTASGKLVLGLTVCTRNIFLSAETSTMQSRDVVMRDILRACNANSIDVEILGAKPYASMFFTMLQFQKRNNYPSTASPTLLSSIMPSATMPKRATIDKEVEEYMSEHNMKEIRAEMLWNMTNGEPRWFSGTLQKCKGRDKRVKWIMYYDDKKSKPCLQYYLCRNGWKIQFEVNPSSNKKQKLLRRKRMWDQL